MSDPIHPPAVDSETDRHRFYAQVASALNQQSGALERAFGAIKGVQEALEAQSGILGNSLAEQSRVLADMRVTGRNIVWAVTIAASIGGSTVTYIVKSFSDMAVKVEQLDRAAEIKEATSKQLMGLPDRVQAITNRLNALEDEVTAMRKGTK